MKKTIFSWKILSMSSYCMFVTFMHSKSRDVADQGRIAIVRLFLPLGSRFGRSLWGFLREDAILDIKD